MDSLVVFDLLHSDTTPVSNVFLITFFESFHTMFSVIIIALIIIIAGTYTFMTPLTNNYTDIRSFSNYCKHIKVYSEFLLIVILGDVNIPWFGIKLNVIFNKVLLNINKKKSHKF